MNRSEFTTLIGGAAITWPLSARAQQPAMPMIRYFSVRLPETAKALASKCRLRWLRAPTR